MAYDWTQRTLKTGVITALEYETWARYNKARGFGPDTYSGDVWGHDIKYISEPEMIVALKQDGVENLKNTYCRVQWGIPYYSAGRFFLSEVVPRLWRLGSPDTVRIVFFFDN